MKSSRSSKKTPALILYFIAVSCLMQTCNCQKDRSQWDLDGDFETIKNYESDTFPGRIPCSLGNSAEDCEDSRKNLMYDMQLWTRQPKHNSALLSAFAAAKKDKSTIFQTSSAKACSCGMDRDNVEFQDLGLLYYPRYVQSVICKSGRCRGGLRCNPKKYNIHVLKRKQPEDVDQPDRNLVGLPEILKDLYLPVDIPVTVACQCGL